MPSKTDISFPDRVRSLKVFADLQTLLDIDILWTEYLSSTSRIAPEDREALIEIAKKMEKILSGVPAMIRTVQGIVQGNTPIAKTIYERFLSAQSKEERRQLERWFGTNGEISEACKVLADRVRKQAVEERSALREKRKAISAGRFRRGDLSKKFICGVCMLTMALAVVLGVQSAYNWAHGQAVAHKC